MSHRFEICDPGLKYRYARLPGTAPKALEVGKTLTTGESSFRDGFGEPTSLERDLLRIGAAIFAADRAAARGEREDFARTIELRLPVANFARLQPLTPLMEGVLRRLSQDGWVLTLVPADAEPEESPPADAVAGKTLLFSGGLDSLAAAVEFSSGHSALDLVSHRTHNTVTSGTQTALVNGLQETGHPVSHHSFFVSSSDVDDLDHDVETTQRTRSFLFLVLGGLVARRTGRREILYMAENGQMAIHLPLTEARIGAFSTHTAHPDVLVEMQKFLSIALAVELKIENPYVLRTKGEVVAVVHSKRPHLIAQSTSCWKNARLRAGVTHCGECIPCYVRRIAIESRCADPTAYGRDVWNEDIRALPPEDVGRRNLSDLASFRLTCATQTPAELMLSFPELFSDTFDGDAVIQMYKRWAKETALVWSRYAQLAPYLV